MKLISREADGCSGLHLSPPHRGVDGYRALAADVSGDDGADRCGAGAVAGGSKAVEVGDQWNRQLKGDGAFAVAGEVEGIGWHGSSLDGLALIGESEEADEGSTGAAAFGCSAVEVSDELFRESDGDGA